MPRLCMLWLLGKALSQEGASRVASISSNEGEQRYNEAAEDEAKDEFDSTLPSLSCSCVI